MRNRLLTAALLGCLVAAAPAFAHHSFAAEYDSAKPVEQTGVITKIEWMNPHVYIYMDVKGADGQTQNWRFEGYPPNTLRRVGFSKEMLKVGDTVTVTGWMAKDALNQFAGREIRWPDGRKFMVGPASQN